jgi:hypothetical protein
VITLRPAARDEANALIRKWHRHHKPVVGCRFSAVATLNGEDVGAVVVSNPRARALAQDARCGEVARLVCRGGDRNVGSKLLGAAWRAWVALGGHRLVSYVRVDEAGAVYRAAGWRPVATTPARDWICERHLTLPGVLPPATESVGRVRWEIATQRYDLVGASDVSLPALMEDV